jgi:predicted GNAT family acetyltransferase
MTEPPAPAADLVVEDNPEESRYEAWLGDRVVGIAEYELPDDAGPITFVHTEVLPDAEGMGVGRGLARGALADVRRRGLKVILECPFMTGYVKRHPEDADLLATHRS